MLSDDWKSKYLELFNSIEETPNQLEVLRRGLVQVSLTAQGVDAELDTLLESLRKSINKPDDKTLDISTILAKIGEQQDTLILKRVQFASNSSLALRSLIRRLDVLNGKDSESSYLLDAMADKNFSMLQLPESLMQLARICDSQIESDEQSTGLTKYEISLKQKAQTFLKQMSIPMPLESEYNKLMVELNTSNGFSEFNRFLESFSQFMIELMAMEKTNFNLHLKNLNAPLSLIESLIHESDANFYSREKIDQIFDNSLNSGLKTIKDNLETTNEIDKLKRQVHQKINQMEQEFVDYNHKRSSTEYNLIEKYQAMKNQFTEMQKTHQNAVAKIEIYRAKSLTDSLTQLPNRAAWENQIKMELEKSLLYGSTLSLAVIDIDHFKKINDVHGHIAGDNVLRSIAKQLKKYLRANDYLSRYGGEEFAVLLQGTKIQDAMTALEKVREKISKARFYYINKQVKVSISAGVSQYKKGDSLEQFFSRADAAMYAAKEAGRNQVKKELIE